MKTLVFLLEEPSAKEMLKAILPRLCPANIQIRYLVFQGKQDLEKNIKKKLQSWLLPQSMFVVLRDQDSSDCRIVKSRLKQFSEESGKQAVLIRIACRELESFYLGDLRAVEQGLRIKQLQHLQNKKKFRNPDLLASPSEELRKLTQNRYDKISGSRAISPFLDLNSNCSISFKMLITGILNLISR